MYKLLGLSTRRIFYLLKDTQTHFFAERLSAGYFILNKRLCSFKICYYDQIEKKKVNKERSVKYLLH